MGKVVIEVCQKCLKAKKHNQWAVLTALEVIQLKARPQEWELLLTTCPECGKKGGE